MVKRISHKDVQSVVRSMKKLIYHPDGAYRGKPCRGHWFRVDNCGLIIGVDWTDRKGRSQSMESQQLARTE